MYKLLALDIDGTLLNSQGQVDPSTIEVIEKIKDHVLVTISTGRPIQGVYRYIDLLGLKSPIITYNGAMIIDSRTDEVLYSQKMNGDDAKQVLELGSQYDTTMIIWSNNKLYSNRINDYVNNYKKLSGLEPIVLNEFDDLIKQGVTKILWVNDPDTLESYQEKIKDLVHKSITYCTSKSHLLEFFDSRVSKAKALEFLGRNFEIKREEMMAIGDGNNDIDMIDYVGMGVAMANATDKVKSVANYITSSNDEDGILNAVNKFIK
ncbi:HAD family phosphatase [Acidaminobacter sp. JC074]|uniref:Cof-type HAD-IIB family hydrolase n=1 Tax=Acidaminobacter sp. JC074 TaxID=2530199 RepID=UPI001F0EA007|nr:Cof-type HAD-IIB family hydrolase [Acidaminobacter sp. JC074]MCH4886469.1 HAD family phosphatase [Acidaminobacter sp. JC074]